MKTILITGGAGFIGSHLCKKYLDEGHRVICVDNLQTTGKPKNLTFLFKRKNFKFIRHDIIYPLHIREKIDWMFNLACSGSYTSYQFDPVHTMKTNTIGVINMLELARKNKAKIMQASTSEIYGDPLEAPQKENYFGNVNVLGPRACYDEGKRSAETLFMDYYREYNVDIKIIRIFNTYGPNMDINDGRAMTNFIVNALDGKDLIIYGDGSYTRSFQYIDDLIEGIDKMMNKDNFTGPVNLGRPGEISMIELAKLIIEKTKSNSNIIFQKKASDDPKRRCPNIASAEEILDWRPKVSLDKGIDNTVEYFKMIQRPDKKILIFATTYYPILGPAEKALRELTELMPDTEFHIITTRFHKDYGPKEKIGNNYIYRVGFGKKLDKYFLPILGFVKAYRLNRKNKYKFAWSIMASYGGLTAVLFKLLNKDINFLITIDKSEIKNRSVLRSVLIYPIEKMIIKKADSIYLSDVFLDKEVKIKNYQVDIRVMDGESKNFVNQVRYSYLSLLNKQEGKLHRPK